MKRWVSRPGWRRKRPSGPARGGRGSLAAASPASTNLSIANLLSHRADMVWAFAPRPLGGLATLITGPKGPVRDELDRVNLWKAALLLAQPGRAVAQAEN